MKKRTSVLIMVAFTSCNAPRTPEDQLYECMHKLYAEYSVDLDQHLDSLEAFYVRENVLESASAQSKLDFLQSVVDSTQPLLNYRSNIGKLHTSIPQLPDDIRNCALREFSERELNNTKEQKIINDCRTFKKAHGHVTHKIVAQANLKYLSEIDFNHPYYRANFLMDLPQFYLPEPNND